MKSKIQIIIAVIVPLFGLYAFMPKASGSHPSATGAPGEGTCANSGCHVDAAVNSGAVANIHTIKDINGNDVTSYMPGETYTISISVTDLNSSKFGFQVTSLDVADEFIGELLIIDVARTQLQDYSDPSSLNREYVTHTFNGNSQVSAGMGSWQFNWVAPSVGSGDITFYYTTNATNSNAANTGDVLYLSDFVLTENSSPSSIDDGKHSDLGLEVSYNENSGSIKLAYSLIESADVMLKITDINGKQVVSKSFGHVTFGKYSELVQLHSKVSAGIYVVNMFINNKVYSEKIYLD